MSEPDRPDGTAAELEGAQAEPSPFEKFQSLTNRLLHVSKDDLREAEASEQDRPVVAPERPSMVSARQW